ncbi:MAG TPA: Do family serine endopeptidase [Stellaceae bacterium]|nr:Do family serine endopeptidase [Stellaceae bacterium]
MAIVPSWAATPAATPAPAPPPLVTQTPPPVKNLEGPAAKGFAAMASHLLPSVVNISTSGFLKNDEGGGDQDVPQLPPGSPFEQFFKKFMNPKGQAPATPQRSAALGSGFIIDPSGLVVTNNHVIADADQITVILQDNTHVPAKLVGHDKATDLALLKFKPPHKLTAVSFGNSDAVRTGDWVMAVGNPYGLGGSVTAGIISARSRAINDDGPYDDFLQTDAPINKGNSGGPLFDLKGRVIGINSAIFSPSEGGSVGIGFAIPANLAKHVVEQFKAYGRVKRGWIGVRLQTVNPSVARAMGLPDNVAAPGTGTLVGALDSGAPAARAGIRQGDIVLRVGGQSVKDIRGLQRLVDDATVGDKINLDIWRDGKLATVSVPVIERDNQSSEVDADQQATLAPQTATVGGLVLSEPTPALTQKYQVPDTVPNVVVSVAKGSLAASQDLKPGDVVLEADQDRLKGPQDLTERSDAARKAGRKSIVLLVSRAGALHYVLLDIAAKEKQAS